MTQILHIMFVIGKKKKIIKIYAAKKKSLEQ